MVTTLASSTPYKHSFAYSALGNITAMSTTSGATTTYTYAETGYTNPHAPTQIGGATLTYDNNGNVITNGNITYTWDYRNRMNTTAQGGATTTYYYDHTYERVKKVSTTTTTYYPSDLYSKEGATTTRFIYGNGELLATVEGNGTATSTRYYHPDHLGSTRLVSNQSGVGLQTMDYYPYGGVRIDNGPYDSDRTYIGELYDPETNLSYLNARYYDGQRGQFTSQDPVFWEVGLTQDGRMALMDPQSQNSYSYSGNNPIRNSDPDGRWYKEFFWDNIATFGNGQSWSSFSGELGDAAYQLGEQSSTWDYAMNHPYRTGAVVGVGSGLAAYGTVAILTSGSGGLSVGQRSLQYRDSLLQGVNNTKLTNIIKNTYKGSDTIEGGTFGALRNELTTGNLTKGLSHAQKAEDTLRGISNVLKGGNLSKGDLNAISKLLNNIQKELNKVPKKPTPKGK